MSVFQDLYHSEINFSVGTFWDGGFDVKLGDSINGFVAEASLDRWGDVEAWLRDAAIRHFPDSLFTQMYRDGLDVWLSHNNTFSPHPRPSSQADAEPGAAGANATAASFSGRE